MNKLWNRISNIGLGDYTAAEVITEYREVFLMNRVMAFLTIVMLMYAPVELIINGTQLIGVVLLQTSLILLVFFFNARKWFVFARYYLMFVIILFIGPMIVLIPEGAGNELTLIPASMLGLLFFKNRITAFVTFLFFVIVYFVATYLRTVFDPIVDVPIDRIIAIRYAFVSIVFLITFIVVYYFKQTSEEYQGLLGERMVELGNANELISEKNKEITDSINYAQRIQQAILPSNEIINRLLANSFVLYKPKDIVAGDFYWCEQVDDLVMFSAADCTGHGVPGAMVSVVCHNALDRSVKEFGLLDAGEILNKTCDIVIETLDHGSQHLKDGMDLAFCVLDCTNMKLNYAGANNSLYLIRKGELTEVKATKQPIGQFDARKEFQSHYIDLEKSDHIIIASDGYVDQFGGPKGKKFKAKRFKELLLSIINEKPELQKQMLNDAFEEWRQDLEQVDDVCVIGIRI